ncbi:hypothetical protein ACFFV7_29725 [Nonomuraea spiralis]|uniref:Uncharacterized protein n=1 Tax=Nonomuraea spiralis TaxID=46182 RepID=A0ABV5ILJ2_9ACTN|nr:hypothetical protein [Nonomuraea spiralis]
MGEQREDLVTMADPAKLAAALVAIGLLKRSFTAAELASEAERAGVAPAGAGAHPGGLG